MFKLFMIMKKSNIVKKKLCYMGTDTSIKPVDIYKDIAEDDETRFGTSNLFIRERTNHFNDSKVFESSNDMVDICRNIEEYNLQKKRKIIVFYDMIVQMLNNKKLNPIVTDYLLEVEN